MTALVPTRNSVPSLRSRMGNRLASRSSLPPMRLGQVLVCALRISSCESPFVATVSARRFSVRWPRSRETRVITQSVWMFWTGTNPRSGSTSHLVLNIFRSCGMSYSGRKPSLALAGGRGFPVTHLELVWISYFSNDQVQLKRLIGEDFLTINPGEEH